MSRSAIVRLKYDPIAFTEAVVSAIVYNATLETPTIGAEGILWSLQWSTQRLKKNDIHPTDEVIARWTALKADATNRLETLLKEKGELQ